MFESSGTVDFSKETGIIRKRHHGSNAAPDLATRGITDFTPIFKQMHFTSSRTHDWALWNNGQRMIDTHFIFPLFKEDPSDVSNYFFGPTDDILAMTEDAGSEVFFRLGTSIEHSGDKHYNTLPIPDYEKYAEILAGIVRHCVKGWGGERKFNIKYWEIWNEPNLGPLMWSEDADAFARFFAIVLRRLKSEFPELKIGGPALCWFDVPFLEKMLDECKKLGVEPDFVSWHRYTSNPDELIAQPGDMRELLDKRGLKNTETIINEWHYILSWEGLHHHVTPHNYQHAMNGPTGMHGIDSAAFNLAVLSGWQETPLDAGFYYGAGMVSTWGFYTNDRDLSKNFFSMKVFGSFVTEFERKVASVSTRYGLYLLGALSKDAKRGCLLVTDYRGTDRSVELEVKGMENAKNISAVVLDDTRDLAPVDVIFRDGKLTLTKNGPGSSVFLITFER